MSGSDTGLYVAIASMISAALSAFVVYRGQKMSERNKARHTNTVEVQTIFDGYSQIVEELRLEVDRLNGTIHILQQEQLLLQEEQIACEKRNDELIAQMEELKARLSQLEVARGQRKR